MKRAAASHLFDDRWEQDRLEHSYYLDTPAFRSLSNSAKHIVLKGHRGTGKTTLLRALDWRERLYNDHLRAALSEDPFENHVIGCFLQIKLLPVDMIDIWTRQSNSQIKHAVIGSYLRASWIVEICSALRGIEASSPFSTYAAQIDDLSSVAEATWGWVPERLRMRPAVDPSILTIKDIESMAKALLAGMRNAASIEIPSPESAVVEFALLEFQIVVDSLFRALATHAGRIESGPAWSFRICMDEGEFLSDDWATSVRTLIRETDSPVYLAVSVLHSLGSETRVRGASISIDDREVVDLDDRTPEQMVQLLNGILRARLKLLEPRASRFDLRYFLGNPDVDDLFRFVSGRSEKPGLAELRAPDVNPVRSHLQKIGAVRQNDSKDRTAESAGYRKKKVAGYLHLLGSVKIDRPFYAGWRIAINMADNSVRDFIRFLRYCLDAWTRGEEEVTEEQVLRFIRQKRLAEGLQDQALDALGRHKLDAMPNTVIRPNETRAIVQLLGEVSHRGDFYSADLRQPNANRIVLPLVRHPTGYSDFGLRLVMILEEAASYGYIAELVIDKDRVSCRVNRGFARHLGFSYWKPQYNSVLDLEAVRRAIAQPGAGPTQWLRGIGLTQDVAKGAVHRPSPSLFPAEEGWGLK